MESLQSLLNSVMELLFSSYPAGLTGVALLLLRLVMGTAFILHGYPKLRHVDRFSEMIHVPVYMAFLSASTMFVGGILLILGLLTPVASFLIGCSMLVAVVLLSATGAPFVATAPASVNPPLEAPSWERAAIYVVISLLLIILGPGLFSLDAFIFGS